MVSEAETTRKGDGWLRAGGALLTVLGAVSLVAGLTWLLLNLHGPHPVVDYVRLNILATVGSTPEYVTTFLPGFMLGGAGVGMTLGTLPAVAAATLPPDRFATGTAVFGMARQLGAAIGVAVLVALLNDSVQGGDLLSGLRRGWWFSLAAGLGTAALAAAFGPVGAPARRPAPELAPPQSAA